MTTEKEKYDVLFVFDAFKMAVRASAEAEAKHLQQFDDLAHIETETELALKAVLTQSGKHAATDALKVALAMVNSCEVFSLRLCIIFALKAVKAISEVGPVPVDTVELLELDHAIMDFKNAALDLAKFPGSVSREDIEKKTLKVLNAVLAKFLAARADLKNDIAEIEAACEAADTASAIALVAAMQVEEAAVASG